MDLVDPRLKRRLRAQGNGTKIGFLEGRDVVLLAAAAKQRVPIYGGPGRVQPVIVGGVVGVGARSGEYEVVLIQRDPVGRITGSATLMLTIGKR